MKTSIELRQERQVEIDAQKEIVKASKARAVGEQDLTDEETTAFRASQAKIESLNSKIIDAENYERNLREAASRSGAPVQGGLDTGDEEEEDKDTAAKRERRRIIGAASIGRALRAVQNGKPLEGAELELHQLGTAENRAAGVETPENAAFNIPMDALRAVAQTVTEDSGDYGGQLVSNQAPRVQMPFAPESVLERLGATRLRNLTGGDIPLPVANNYNFEWLAETEEITIQKQQFAGPLLQPKRLGAAVEISNRLLLQSSVDVEGMIRGLILAGYNRAINIAAINGSGTANQPTGVLNTVGVQTSTIVAGEAASRKAIVELPALLANVDSTTENLAYLYTNLLRADLMARKADAGSGLYLQQEPNILAGYPAVASSFVPQLAALEVIIFGDWSKLFIGEWGALSVLSDPYSSALKNSLRLVLNGHAGVAIAQPEAFAVNKFMDAAAV